MNLGKITLITPPDRLFNINLSYLLVKPSNYVKEQFQTILSKSVDDLNVYIFEFVQYPTNKLSNRKTSSKKQSIDDKI
jgi:hypothetical protein